MKILIADDHSVVRKGLITILLDEFSSAEIDESSDAHELIEKAQNGAYDVIISDINMPGPSIIDAIKSIKNSPNKGPILILSVNAPEQYAIRVIKAGASGYLTKESAPEELVVAIKHVLSGRKYITAEVAELLADAHDNDSEARHNQLSNREFEVMRWIASGKTVSEIGEIMHLSTNTISTYRTRILLKMNMNTNAELTSYAIKNNLV
ncbi:MAG: response regulator transcription factor [Sediminibacterium sp.]|jgi:DNA-binding NarL/FixJ family response regulator|nr:response regulator transcription factor [Sediminibacterium sp.]